MTGDLRSSILTTAAVAASVAGLTVIQPLTAAPPLLLAALLMDTDAEDYTGVGGVADALQGKLLPADGKAALVNFLTGPFGLWNALDPTVRPEEVVPSTTLGVASSLPFTAPLPSPPAEAAPAPAPPIPPVGPSAWPAVPAAALPGAVVAFNLPSLEIGDSIVVPPITPPWNSAGRPVIASYGYDLGSYAAASLLNPFALTNSVAAYLERALTGTFVPVNPDGSVGCRNGQSTCSVKGGVISQYVDDNGVLHITFTNANGGTVKATVETRDGTTYVTYDRSGSLPLVRPLRDYGGLLGNELADLLEPALTALVYWGYRDEINGDNNNLLPSMSETIRAVLDFIVGVKEGLESLLQPHMPEKTVVATAVPTEDAELDATAEKTATGDEPPASSTPAPPKPVAISVDDAVEHLTDLFQPKPDEAGEDASDEDVDTDDTAADSDEDHQSGSSGNGGGASNDDDSDTPKQVKRDHDSSAGQSGSTKRSKRDAQSSAAN